MSETEPELGLGVLVDHDRRIIQVRFDSSDCTRQYALSSAPLKRVIFKPGDEIQLKDSRKLIIETLTESHGLIYYSGNHKIVCESDLADTLSFSMPQDRLFAGITDTNKLFDTRYQLLQSKAGYDASPAKGFIGGRVELIPHQFYIADTVTSRYVPRVLLSDETGLGKTIEACLVLHKLLTTHRVKRVLIIVPESLVHQWFVELYRKFNLSFTLVNEAYCSSIEHEDATLNPFLEHQLGIVGIDFLDTAKRKRQIIAAGWDMLVIDEAHHITDNRNTHTTIQTLARQTFGLMLLTATPEQMGIKNHFLHLQLLDPERYFDFKVYQDETAQYKKTIKTVKALIRKGKNADHILDSYGPGRVIFRNKREVIKGFPERTAHLTALPASRSHIRALNQAFSSARSPQPRVIADDPRIGCLVEQIRKKEKVLVICSSKKTVAAIASAIATHISVDVARFDETMTLMQRDRNAAWFARQDGARVLVCSEIGSEGRNFQFVHHLFLFDLPWNPELLEQRIGRVDRIGQKNAIQIHVPYIRGTVFEILARWYMDGLNLFEKNLNGVHLIYNRFKPDLQALFDHTHQCAEVDEALLTKLILETKSFCEQTGKQLAQGKNILLEMNSFKPEHAARTIDRIVRAEADARLEALLIQVLDHYGIENNGIDKTLFKLDPTHMADEHFPLPKNLSAAMTFKRATAIVRDDVDFFTWDHPFVQQTFEYFITNNAGSCATAVLEGQGCQQILIETVFMLECVAPQHLNIERYLTAEPIRILVNHEGKDIGPNHETHAFSRALKPDNSNWFKNLEPVRQTLIPSMIETSRALAEKQSDRTIKTAEKRIKDILGNEIIRLSELKKINPDIREQELQLARDRMNALLDHLSTARLRMDALRLIRVS